MIIMLVLLTVISQLVNFLLLKLQSLKIAEQIETISPAEIIVSKEQKDELELLILKNQLNTKLTKIDDWIFNTEYANDILKDQFKTQTLKGFGISNLSFRNYFSWCNSSLFKRYSKIQSYSFNKSCTL